MPGNMTQYLENQVLTHLFRTSTFTKPVTLAVALCSGTLTNTATGNLQSLEIPNANGYARQALNPLDANWAATTYTSTSGLTSNTPAIAFPACVTAPWGQPVTNVAILDSTAWGSGNCLWYGPLNVPKTIGVGDTFSFGAGNLAVYVD